MTTREFNDRTVCHKWAAKQRPDKADRLVLACEECPPSRRSRRRPVRWSTVAGEVAAEIGANPAALREALREALERERARQ